MREPNIKELMESLAEEDFLEIIFQRNRDASEEVAQLMYFYAENRLLLCTMKYRNWKWERNRKYFPLW